MLRAGFEIDRLWSGAPAEPGEHARVSLELDRALVVRVDAPFHGDPPPDEAPGSVAGLWEYEVVELFLLGADDRYLEIELGPRGHYLVLTLAGRRQLEHAGHEIRYEARVEGARWQGRAEISPALLPPDLRAANAYAIHGSGEGRRYLAAHPVPGAQPDFHRLECFAALVR